MTLFGQQKCRRIQYRNVCSSETAGIDETTRRHMQEDSHREVQDRVFPRVIYYHHTLELNVKIQPSVPENVSNVTEYF